MERVSSVRIEHHEPGRLGIGESRPRLSWSVETDDPDYRQRSARIEVTRSTPGRSPRREALELEGERQILIDWPFSPLVSRERIDVRIQLQNAGRWSEWSDSVSAEAGLLDPSDWTAQWISAPWPEPKQDLRRPPRFRREFDLPSGVRSARAYVTAHGVIELELNGHRVGDEELTPGWTSYHHRLRYATFDVTTALQAGPNALGAWMGDGWWRGRIGYGGGHTDFYGDTLAAAVQLEVLLETGETVRITSDGEWTAGYGPVILSGLYEGELFDAREHDPTWSQPGSNSVQDWERVSSHAMEAEVVVAPTGPPVRCVEELHPVWVDDRGGGRYILDFGQNHSGRLRVRANGEAGSVIRLRHAEVLLDGELATEPLRTATATDELTLAGGSIEWEPRFTIHGYRFVEVTGWSGALTALDIVSRVLHTDMERTGWFSSSSTAINRLHENVVWSLRGNFVDIPTDCPQRDERLGWTGDIQVFGPSAAFLYDVTGMLSSWLQDLSVEQKALEWVPLYVPYMPLDPWQDMTPDPTAVWGDVTVLTPWDLYRETGDTQLLARQYESGVEWMNHVRRGAGDDLICEGTLQLGDWLDPNAPPEDPMKALTNPVLVATAYAAFSARKLASIARVLGKDSDAEQWEAYGAAVARAYADRFIDAEGRVEADTQTGYALTTAFDLWPDERLRAAGTTRLADLVRESGGRVSTGFAGTPVVTDALSSSGHLEQAYSLLECSEAPSWLYGVEHGATTIWERWDSLRPDGSLNAGSMTSFNHYALGAVADWMHRVVAGIAADAPGWRRIRFAPRPGGSLTSASARHETPYGPAEIAWNLEEGELRVTMMVPPGTTGIVDVPGVPQREVTHGRHDVMIAFDPATEAVTPSVLPR